MLTIETFKPEKITAISVDDQRSGENKYTSIKFAYDGGEMPSIRIDGKFRLFRFRNECGYIYSLSITCNDTNEPFFRELCKAISRESCKIVRKSVCKSIKPKDFKLVRDNRSGQSVYAKIYSKKSGKVQDIIRIPSQCNRSRRTRR